ncbi:MAG TPA: hypothetical protein VFB72_17870 [Verrucomicrobiae bacterium]|nr:hypothetical protein [Verrucomicrobiae bacterium]
MRSILKSGQRKNQLSIEGRWDDLDRYFERASKPRRPFVWLYRRYLLPGTNTVQHALLLYNQGRLEESLAKVDKAIREVANKPKIFSSIYRRGTFKTFCSAFRARTLVLTGLGRYDEARQVAAQLRQLSGGDGQTNAALALMEYFCGNLDEALAQAKIVPPEDTQYDSMRVITASAYSLKGEFDNALQALVFEPSDLNKYYTPEGLRALNSSSTGARLIELQRKKLAGVFQPARLILLAQVYNSMGEFDKAAGELDEAAKSLGPEPAIQLSYCRHRACSFAGLGKAAEAESFIERMRAMVQKTPKRSLVWETHFATGQSYSYLGRSNAAIDELNKALHSALHPVEKHVTAYWIARTHKAGDNKSEANPYYQMVLADPIPSWMRKEAADALATR